MSEVRREGELSPPGLYLVTANGELVGSPPVDSAEETADYNWSSAEPRVQVRRWAEENYSGEQPPVRQNAYYGERAPLLSHQELVEQAGIIDRGVKAENRLIVNGLARVFGGGDQIEASDKLLVDVINGQRARDAVYAANIGLVISIAAKYKHHAMSFDDIVQEGGKGLLRAIDKYDAQKGFKFSTYAKWWIRESIQREIKTKGRMIHLPTKVESQARQVVAAEADLYKLKGQYPSSDQVAEHLGMEKEEVELLKLRAVDVLSYEVTVSKSTGLKIVDKLADEDSQKSFEQVEEDSVLSNLEAILSELSQEDRQILNLRYLKGYTIKEAASALKMAEATLSNHEHKALIVAARTLAVNNIIKGCDLSAEEATAAKKWLFIREYRDSYTRNKIRTAADKIHTTIGIDNIVSLIDSVAKGDERLTTALKRRLHIEPGGIGYRGICKSTGASEPKLRAAETKLLDRLSRCLASGADLVI